MWSKTFTDSYGWRWTFRKQREWRTVQLLATPPEVAGGERLEPFSYGFEPEDLERLAGIVAEAREELARPEPEPIFAIHLWPSETAALDKTGYRGCWHVPASEADATRLRNAGAGCFLADAEEPRPGELRRAFFFADELEAQVRAAEEELELVTEVTLVRNPAGTYRSGGEPFRCSPDESAGAREELRAGRDPRD